MVFYEDFVKKVKEKEFNLEKEKYNFGANYNQMISNFGIGIPLILLGLFEIYSMFLNGFSFRIIIALLIMIYGLYILYNVLSYKIVIDTNSKNLKDKKINIDLDKVTLCELRKMVAPRGKKLQFCLNFYTEDKKEIILPLIMSKKLDFVLLLKKLLGAKFQIIEEK